ncbi:hypothetical protein JCM10213_006740 [Rhodosporidiobolus nylandii]
MDWADRRTATLSLSVFYGLPVTSSSLVYASIAWRALVGPSRFLDLVSLRKHCDTGSNSGVVDDIPVEIWDAVRDHLITDALLDAKEELICGLACRSWQGCGGGGGYGWLKELDVRVKEVYEGAQEVECPRCGQAARVGGVLHQQTPLDKDVPRFLAAHGLAIASRTLYPVRGSNGWSTSERLALLSLPLRVKVPDSLWGPDALGNEIIHEEADEGLDDGRLLDFDTRTPVNADERFNLIVRRFKLESREDKDCEVAAVPEEEVCGDKGVKPRWRVFFSLPSSHDC